MAIFNFARRARKLRYYGDVIIIIIIIILTHTPIIQVQKNIYIYILYRSMDDNFGEWVESMGVASGRG